jgi:3-oxoacyl-[acyl-carrier protein] reductase
MGKLAGKVAIVTGAGRGLGRAISERLARDGSAIVVNYRSSRDEAERVVDGIRSKGGRAVAVQADVTLLEQIPWLFAAAEEKFGRFDILVNNAGIGISAAFGDLKEAEYDRLFAVTKGVYFTLQYATPRIAEGGRIINLSTGLTRNWAPNAAAYAGSKAAIEQFTRSLSRELGPRGVTVNAVLPGFTETEMTSHADEVRRAEARSRSSFGRLGQPDDIADVVAFLASNDGRWLTGQSLVANGGSTP